MALTKVLCDKVILGDCSLQNLTNVKEINVNDTECKNKYAYQTFMSDTNLKIVYNFENSADKWEQTFNGSGVTSINTTDFKSLTIPSNVSTLMNCFENCSSLTKVGDIVLNESTILDNLGVSLFNNCPNLTSVGELKNIYDLSSALYDCPNLENASNNYTLKISGYCSCFNSFMYYQGSGENNKIKTLDLSEMVGIHSTDTTTENLDMTSAFTSSALEKVIFPTDINVNWKDGYMDYTFGYQLHLTTLENKIPNSVKIMKSTFSYCRALTSIPNIPTSCETLESCFAHCDSLTTIPEMPNTVKYMNNAFQDCGSLVSIPNLSTNLQDGEDSCALYACFYNCVSLTSVPTMPNQIQDLTATFYNCTSLTTVPNLSTSCTSMLNTFYGCENLTSVPTLPNGVTNLKQAFTDCFVLTSIPNLPTEAQDMTNTFFEAYMLNSVPTIPSKVTSLKQTFVRCISLAGEIKIESRVVGNAANCFYYDSSSTVPGDRTLKIYRYKENMEQIPANYSDTYNSFVTAGYIDENGVATGKHKVVSVVYLDEAPSTMLTVDLEQFKITDSDTGNEITTDVSTLTNVSVYMVKEPAIDSDGKITYPSKS